MRRISVAVGLILLATAIFLLYKPVAILVFHITEPKFLCPVAIDETKIRNDGYGDGCFGAKRNGGRIHLGVDLQAPIGTPVFAAKSGLAVGRSNRGMGKFVVIQHIDGTKTIYGHLSKAFIDQRGENVKIGDIIGEVGKTGNAWNPCMLPHLHFEIWIDGEPVDPFSGYMKAR